MNREFSRMLSVRSSASDVTDMDEEMAVSSCGFGYLTRSQSIRASLRRSKREPFWLTCEYRSSHQPLVAFSLVSRVSWRVWRHNRVSGEVNETLLYGCWAFGQALPLITIATVSRVIGFRCRFTSSQWISYENSWSHRDFMAISCFDTHLLRLCACLVQPLPNLSLDVIFKIFQDQNLSLIS